MAGHRYKNKTNRIGIPTNGKTTPFWQGGYYYTRQGGTSSTFPYIAGILACATQGNELFFTRKNWPDELRNIIKQTATNSPEHGLAINPDGIAETVTQIQLILTGLQKQLHKLQKKWKNR